ncbi:hypothetical protein [Prauserella muralis]|uniref:Uncharacterized protein n=1 Tax=Prauserella muralis TaxID=588067 RepID=A0A2V4AHL3_9PSEU|nr:hypothetical protein [Prauserella muralis]PXY19388.1 hypothetical protein BAY60_32075 [Prauserella muralis]TWE29355.1 putative membrane protein [Prauserella muralis]
MIDVWTLVRFVHVVGAALWVGGQLTLTAVVLPPVRALLGLEQRATLLRSVGRRFAVVTMAVLLPSQIATGWLLAWRHGVTWQSLAEPGYGRVLVAKLTLFALVMAATSVHGIAQGKGRPRLARTASVAALTGSLGVVLLATGLVGG